MKTLRQAGWLLTAMWCAIQLTAAWGGIFNPAHVGALPSILVLAFDGITIATVILTVTLALCRCRKAAAVCTLSLLLSLPTLYQRCPVTLNHNYQDKAPDFTLLTFNVQGFDFNDYRGDTSVVFNESMRFILDTDADVVSVIEPYYLGRCYEQQPTIAPLVESLHAKYPYRYHYERDNIDLFSKYPFTTHELLPPQKAPLQREGDLWPHYEMAFDIEIDSAHHVNVVVAHLNSYLLTRHERRVLTRDVNRKYVKSENIGRKFGQAFVERGQHARALRSALDSIQGNLVMGCDLNDVAGSYTYRTLMGDDMTDAFVHCSTGPGYPYQNYHLNFRIDHVLYRGHLEALSCQVLKAGRSDHHAVLTRFAWR